jgi:hypothetical protein
MTINDFETIDIPHLTDQEIDDLITPDIIEDLFNKLYITLPNIKVKEYVVLPAADNFVYYVAEALPDKVADNITTNIHPMMMYPDDIVYYITTPNGEVEAVVDDILMIDPDDNAWVLDGSLMARGLI